MTRSVIRWVIAGILATGLAPGQQQMRDPVKVLTVCEVLANVSRYADTAVAVVGRLEHTASLIDHYEFLSQDRCEHPLITHGHIWANKIQVWTLSEEEMPKRPVDRPNLEQSVVAAKLSIIRKLTILGSHEDPQFKSDGKALVYAGKAPAPNECGCCLRSNRDNRKAERGMRRARLWRRRCSACHRRRAI